ncbi:M10 family metallopeptidase C-terminal domain-containing protein [Microvirga pudoricolor]|uniref:M10 family metallopeptidase C-terminal domain-containing protein n=1 Tax=Microvirga pudoricolor TaxID=2778729 RepID=UPI0019519DAC|nr:M10 family metallopeptidase C-terminal domain-containing protein [Microvirga pudoricolor]MBM6593023.1 right-handed parallel beta-helix repeat-containing protein [Microvirga pudoricolor]
MLDVNNSAYASASATTAKSVYYVSPTGKDSNNGSELAPFATLQAAANVASPGTTVYVAPGTYKGHVFSTASGTDSARIRYVSTAPNKAIIKVDNVKAEAIWKNTGSYVDIEGFEIIGTDNATIGIHNNASHVRVLGNKIHDIRDLTGSSNGGAGILMDGYKNVDNDVIGNEIYNIGFGPVSGNPYFHALYLSDSGGVVQDNIIHDNRGRAIQTNHGSSNKDIVHNTLTNNFDGILIANYDGAVKVPAAGFYVADNVIIGSRNWAIIEDGNTGANVYKNNMLFGNNNETYNSGLYLNKVSTATGTTIMDQAQAISLSQAAIKTGAVSPEGATPSLSEPTPSASTSKNLKITGTEAVDRLQATDLSTKIYAKGGNDILRGGAGHDLLDGGAGRDKLFGGPGHDTFYFASAKDAHRDIIQDFVQGEDRIHLSKIDAIAGGTKNEAFSFIGKHGFTTAGQLHFTQDKTKGVTYIEGNINSDPAADFKIQVKGLHTFGAADFIL